ncbi:probable serine/threonine-protein kinase DDB_G0280133 [Anopheles ziemanni]|uniref:probable serine/threonine-protein kinase DDB_G0280133 n=1 Tax=Anopheles coustani TaxID=139045 RepID=UPI0026582C08|nr:probable serine/threonine-protein kinase DDB_G0280133 [Anopheles coustani]XP_058177660.1 probable serine/threonine-protein kinase DDB_G0280133 [Anopheles ziemanni]
MSSDRTDSTDDGDLTLLSSSISTLSSDEEFSSNEAIGNFFIGYRFMAILSIQDVNEGSRGPKFFCHICEHFLHTRLSMITHMKMHRMPFCPVCFAMFHRPVDVNSHIVELHPEITTTEIIPALVTEEMLSIEDSIVPPNSPNNNEQQNITQEQLNGKLDTNNNNSMSSLLVEKLREHQIANGLVDDEGQHNQHDFEIDTETQLTSNPADGNGRSMRNNDKKPVSSGSSGKAPKGKPKSSPKTNAGTKGPSNAGQEDNIMKVTSRFGRSISLKIPQF